MTAPKWVQHTNMHKWTYGQMMWHDSNRSVGLQPAVQAPHVDCYMSYRADTLFNDNYNTMTSCSWTRFPLHTKNNIADLSQRRIELLCMLSRIPNTRECRRDGSAFTHIVVLHTIMDMYTHTKTKLAMAISEQKSRAHEFNLRASIGTLQILYPLKAHTK